MGICGDMLEKWSTKKTGNYFFNNNDFSALFREIACAKQFKRNLRLTALTATISTFQNRPASVKRTASGSTG